MDTPFLSRNLYYFLYGLLGIVYLSGLFVPLMDNDSAHHANIALHMHLSGDYVSLVDHNGAYLDKPHLHFWLAALSYKLFGVTSFAYRFPSFLFTLLGIYSVYRLGKALYDNETGKLSALLMASAFAFILANTDVRMDAILTACIAYSCWQLVAFIQEKKNIHVAGAALALALGFCTKGPIAVFVPAAGTLFYIAFRKEWKLFLHAKWLLMAVLFALFISPVVYCYYLQFNRHPELVVRGKDHINGVTFILFNQSVERFGGKMGSDGSRDPLFFLHSFLWAFAPWSLAGLLALGKKIGQFTLRKEEWFTTGGFLAMFLVVTFSGFKLPHYLNVVFPLAAVFTAAYLLQRVRTNKTGKMRYVMQLVISVLLLVLATTINGWVFPVHGAGLIAAVVLLLAVVFYFYKSTLYTREQKTILIPFSSMVLCFFLLNTNFYPQLLRYQGGNELARISRNIADPGAVYFWKETYSSSYNFYTSSLRQPFADSVLIPGKKTWLLYDIGSEPEIRQGGYTLGNAISVPDFEVTRLNGKFLDPETREEACGRLVIAEISK